MLAGTGNGEVLIYGLDLNDKYKLYNRVSICEERSIYSIDSKNNMKTIIIVV